MREVSKLWDLHTPLVVGVSGGGDSMALMGLLASVTDGAPIYPVHIDHGLRPESRDDAAWVATTVKALWGFKTEVMTTAVVAQSGESVEMAARRVRYGALGQIAETLGPSSGIMVAHHYDDQVETILMRILVGTSLSGLGGMRPIQGRVLRPLLTIRKETLQSYREDTGIPWLEDPTNVDPKMLRNRIRHQILPMLGKEVNPRVDAALTRLASRAREVSEEMSRLVQDFLDTHKIDLSQPLVVLPGEIREESPARLLAIFGQYGLLHHLRLSTDHLESALRGDVTWPHGVTVHHLPDRILIGKSSKPGDIPFGDPTPIPLFVGKSVTFRGATVIMTHEAPLGSTGSAQWISGIDAVRWPHPAVRGWMPGDALRPVGLHGTKKLQDLFVDAKVARPMRHQWPVVTAGPWDGAPILAVVGIAVSEHAKPEIGQKTYWIRWIPGPNWDG